MASNTLTKLSEELSILESELESFKSSVAYLNQAKSNVQKAVDTVVSAEIYHQNKLKEIEIVYEKNLYLIEVIDGLIESIKEIDFPLRLDRIEKRLGTVIQELNRSVSVTMEDLRKASQAITELNFEEKIISIRTKVEEGDKKNADIIDKLISETSKSIGSIHESLQFLYADNIKNFTELDSKIESWQLTTRLDQLKKLNNELQVEFKSLKIKIEKDHDNLIENIKVMQGQFERKLQSFENTYQIKINKMNRQNTFWNLVIIIVIVLTPIFFKYIKFKY